MGVRFSRSVPRARTGAPAMGTARNAPSVVRRPTAGPLQAHPVALREAGVTVGLELGPECPDLLPAALDFLQPWRGALRPRWGHSWGAAASRPTVFLPVDPDGNGAAWVPGGHAMDGGAEADLSEVGGERGQVF